MRVEHTNGRYLLCGAILPLDKLAVGQVWCADDFLVTIFYIEKNWVTYRWITEGKLGIHEKDAFSFQCRYCLVLDGPDIPEELL